MIWLSAIWSVVKPFVKPFLTPILIAAAVIATAIGFMSYDRWIDDPAVTRAARENYVQLSERDALQARIDEVERQLVAAQLTRIGFETLLDQQRAKNTADNERHAQENADYEAKLKAAGRSCPLDDADIDWLRKP